MNRILLVLLAAFFLSSCDSSSDADDSNLSPKWVMPEEGTRFRYQITTTDSLFENGVLIDGQAWSEEDDLIVVESNSSFLGRDKVFMYGWGTTSRMYHVTFEPNGDTGYEIDEETLEIFPTGKKGRKTIRTIDTVINGIHSVTTGHFETFGWENITIGDTTVRAIKLIKVTHVAMMPEGGSEVMRETSVEHTHWFVPSLGIAAKGIRKMTDDANGFVTHYSRTQQAVEIL